MHLLLYTNPDMSSFISSQYYRDILYAFITMLPQMVVAANINYCRLLLCLNLFTCYVMVL